MQTLKVKYIFQESNELALSLFLFCQRALIYVWTECFQQSEPTLGQRLMGCAVYTLILGTVYHVIVYDATHSNLGYSQ